MGGWGCGKKGRFHSKTRQFIVCQHTRIGGRIFPGIHHRASFKIHEMGAEYELTMRSFDDETKLAVRCHETDIFPKSSVFASLDEASSFFRGGSVGYSPSRNLGCYDGLDLRTSRWSISALAVDELKSSYFENTSHFPSESIRFDCGLLMKGIDHSWHVQPMIRDP